MSIAIGNSVGPIFSLGRFAVLGMIAACICFGCERPLAQPSQPSEGAYQTEIWDIELGQSIFAFDEKDLMAFACGTNGGPPGRPLNSFRDFLDCESEETGFREVYFEYDDERLYWARAHRYEDIVLALGGGTRVFGSDVILSVLVDELGIVQGWRVATDPRHSVGRNENLFEFGLAALAWFGEEGWDCIDYPRSDGRESVGGAYLDRSCSRKEEDRELRIRIEHYRKPGQQLLNSQNLQPNVGSHAFYSAARLEIIRDPNLSPQGPVLTRPDPEPTPELTGDPEVDFLSGASNACLACDLSGANLKRRNLANANLAGASLAGANLHASNLESAILTDANLAGSNLNMAILTRADLRNADLSAAMAFAADFSRANLDGAILNEIMAGEARFALANMTNTQLLHGDFRNALMMSANLAGSVALLTYFDNANLFQVDLRGAQMVPASFWGANLRRANAQGGDFRGSDFLEADLAEAVFDNANLAQSRLFRANMFNTTTANARFFGAILPDGSVASPD